MPLELHAVDSGAPTSDGESTRLPLLIVHGLMGSVDNWRSHIKQWQVERRVVAVDLRNHGRSPHVSGMHYDDMAHDVLAVLDRLEIGRCHVLGHSMGGKVAMTLARRHPERVASLMVADIAPVTYQHGHDTVFAAMRHVENHAPTDRRGVDRLMADFITEKATRLFLATNLVRDDEGVMRWRIGLDEIETDYDNIRIGPGGDGHYLGPSLLLRGVQSDYASDEMLPQVREVMPHVQVVTLDAGHWLHAEQPEAFQAAVNDFLAAIEA
ncbi:alpha/beta fold hydrolase [Aidingimonas halophila]|uniref:Esterase n=1 Tax=Aidingimonas halophila TaxID=574349 RepID=A0A1H3BGF8_9GAMM|nr:alpha/beta fold hydrolase [Aidingimonas halophila]GHC26483.1 alpha/beta hydrolase [Aidingimonas halophila]SDX41023.1 esterase [Aidingimonas halophila]